MNVYVGAAKCNISFYFEKVDYLAAWQDVRVCNTGKAMNNELKEMDKKVMMNSVI